MFWINTMLVRAIQFSGSTLLQEPADAFLTGNINTQLDLANGTSVILHSLTFANSQDEYYAQQQAQLQPPGSSIFSKYNHCPTDTVRAPKHVKQIQEHSSPPPSSSLKPFSLSFRCFQTNHNSNRHHIKSQRENIHHPGQAKLLCSFPRLHQATLQL